MVDVILECGCETFLAQVASESHPVPLELALKVHFARPDFFLETSPHLRLLRHALSHQVGQPLQV